MKATNVPTSVSALKLLRKVHLYFGVFIAPAILFFAFTGALQTFSLHETTPGSDYKPPRWIVTLAQLHKHQTIARALPTTQPRSQKAASEPAAPHFSDVQPPKPKSPVPMKVFFLLVAIGLFTSTFSGLYMTYKYNRSKLVVATLLFGGIIIPFILTRF